MTMKLSPSASTAMRRRPFMREWIANRALGTWALISPAAARTFLS